jgi:hypothetical protein
MFSNGPSFGASVQECVGTDMAMEYGSANILTRIMIASMQFPPE